MLTAQIFAASIILWIMFIIFANFKEHLRHDHAPPIEAVMLLFTFIFGVVDVIFNVVYGSIVFLQFPHYKRLTLTARMRYILLERGEYDWRFRLADVICRRLVEPWDWNHCGLAETYDNTKRRY